MKGVTGCIRRLHRHCTSATVFPKVLLVNRKMSIRLFEGDDHSKLYAKYRPTYPEEVFRTIDRHCRQTLHSNGKLSLAVDVGCGNGQGCAPLLKYFDKVIGLDVSEKQIQQAKSMISGVDFRVGPGEDLNFLAPESVDLITVAQAFHWMNAEELYEHVTRVLRPGGSFVVYGYGNPSVDNEAADDLITKQFYDGLLETYWDNQRRHIENKYRDYVLPFPGWYRNDDLEIRFEWSVDAVIGYLSSWSAWQSYNHQHPGNKELEKLRDKLYQLYTDEETNEVKTITIKWPIFMLLSTKPL